MKRLPWVLFFGLAWPMLATAGSSGNPTRNLVVLDPEGELPGTRAFLQEIAENFAAHRGVSLRVIRGRAGLDPGTGDPVLLLKRRVDPPVSPAPVSNRVALSLPLMPIRDVFLENRRTRLRNENQIFSATVWLVDDPGVRRLVNALEARYGQTLDVRWAQSISEALAYVRVGKSPWTILDSDLATFLASGDPDFTVNWRYLEALVPVKTLCLTAWETPEGDPSARSLAVHWAQWLGDRKEGALGKLFLRHGGIPYFAYLNLGGSNLRQWDGELERRRTQDMLADYEGRLARLHGRPLADWGPVALEYLGAAGPYEVRLDELDYLLGAPTGDRQEWFTLIQRRLPQVWDRWVGLRGGETNWSMVRPGGLSFMENFWSDDDKRGLARDYLRVQGERAMKARNWEDAVKLLSRLDQENPGEGAVRKLLGEAIARRDQEAADVRRRQMVATFREAARLAETRGDLEGARVSWLGVRDLLPEDLEARKGLEVAQNLIRERDRRDELVRLKSMMEEAIAQYQAGRYEPAAGLLESCLQLAPGNRQAQEYLDLALGALEQAGQDHGDPRSPYHDLLQDWARSAKKAEEAGDAVLAEKEWLRILNLFPGHLEAEMGRLRAREKLKPGTIRAWADAQWEEVQNLKRSQQAARAKALTDRIRLLSPTFPGLTETRTNLEAPRNTPPTSNDPAWFSLRYEEGMKAYARDDWGRAQKLYQEILDRDPRQDQARLFLDRIRTRQAFAEGASATNRSGAREDLIEKLHQRALELYNQGRVDEAVSEWERILQLDGQDRKAQNSLRRVKTLKGKQ